MKMNNINHLSMCVWGVANKSGDLIAVFLSRELARAFRTASKFGKGHKSDTLDIVKLIVINGEIRH